MKITEYRSGLASFLSAMAKDGLRVDEENREIYRGEECVAWYRVVNGVVEVRWDQ